MSANNWTWCPYCAKDRADEVAAEEKRVADLYGKVTVEQFDEARAALAAMHVRPVSQTFREDYEFYGAEGGIVEWVYKGRCSTCGAHAQATGGLPVVR